LSTLTEIMQCNYCGIEFDEFDKNQDLKIHTLVGYGSKHDGERILLRFCCDCFDKIIDECKISPTVSSVW